MARLVVTVGATGILHRVVKTMAGHMLMAIKDGNADDAANFAKLAADAAATLMNPVKVGGGATA